MQELIIALQAFLLIGGGLFFLYLKRLPETIHQKSIKSFEFKLNSELEELRASLTEEIELLKITEAELQGQKTEELVELIAFFNQFVANPEKMDNMNAKQMEQYKQNFINLGTKLFLFSSDTTIQKYIEFRLTAQGATGTANFRILQIYSELVLEIRKDLGHKNTKIGNDDYLKVILSDWDEYKAKHLS